MDKDFLIPSVILWSPYLIYTQIVPPASIKCIDCGQFMSEGYWIDGSSAAKQPCLLHGIEKVVLMISTVHRCKNWHTILAHDEIVLQMFPSQAMIP